MSESEAEVNDAQNPDPVDVSDEESIASDSLTEPEPEPLAFDDPARCPTSAGAGYYCVLPIYHDGPHSWSEEPYRPEEEAHLDTRAPSDWRICPACAGMGKVPEEFSAAPDKQTCVACRGLGMTATGSLVEDQAVLMCDACGGKGWSYRPVTTENATAEPPVWQARF